MSAARPWTETRCSNCGGHGIVSDYGHGEDFYGPKECDECEGTGRLFVSPAGRLAVYPGGPFRGQKPGVKAARVAKRGREQMRVLDIFSGVGGFSLGLERTSGFKTIGFCEIDPFCRAVLAKHWPDVPCHGDVTTYEFKEGEADVITGGFPCQDVSLAGRRAGLSGSRSGLYRELVRAIRVVRPRYGIVENVAALLSDGMGTVLGDLAESGIDAEWDCIPASAVGAPHERDRVWIVAHTDSVNGRPGGKRPDGKKTGHRAYARCATDDAPDVASPPRQPRLDGSLGSTHSHAESVGCRQGRPGRPPDSFARIRDEARRNAADPYSARLAFRESLTRDAWEERQAAERNPERDVGQSLWPDEPALQGMDDGLPHWMDRVRATGNAVVPQIPKLIGRAILDARAAV